jgi:choline dehydrogenase-like flavoprotein
MLNRSYDVVVVGAGSAGAALAARLTEDVSRTVLLIEDGPDYRSADAPPEVRSIEPARVQPTEALVHLQYADMLARRTPVQEPALYFRGRGVGGSSSINGMFAIRATVEDFDGWAAAGAKGWSYEEALPVLRAMEADADFGHLPYHGDSGPVPVMRVPRELFSPLDAAIDTVAERAGHPWSEDHNAPGTTGVSPFAFNARDGRRVSTNDAYLEPARSRPNLVVIGDATVDRVLVREGRAVGVRVLVGGEVHDVPAAEVVVCAGAIHSPAVLQRSGIGPADLLGSLGIDVVVDLPVGKGLQEHPGIALELALREPPDYRGAPQRGQVCVRLTSGVGDELNDLMIANCGALGIGLPVAGVAGWVNRVTSTGQVAIRSTDATLPPRVDFNLLATDDDMQRFRAVVEELCSWAHQPELKDLTSGMTFGLATAADVARMGGAEFRDFALASVADTVHGTSSCRIGAPGDPDAVVDATGRVFGVEGLRVADASILPWCTRANTNLTAIFVGEQVARWMT